MSSRREQWDRYKVHEILISEKGVAKETLLQVKTAHVQLISEIGPTCTLKDQSYTVINYGKVLKISIPNFL